MTEDVFSRVQRVLSQVLNIPESDVTADTAQESTPTWDSLHHVHVITALEQEFGISVDADQLLELTDVRAILAYVSQPG